MECVMLCGIPTSGKSTYVEKLLKLDYWQNSVVLSTDYFIEFYAKQHRKTYNEVFYDVIRTAIIKTNALLKFALENNKHIIWDQTNLSISSRKEKLSKIPKNYHRSAMYFEISLEEALRRNEVRKLTGKEIPVKVLKNMHNKFVIPTIEEGFEYVECGNQA
jgi:predicted kinase